MSDILGRIHSVESFGLVDGPGVRYVVFLQGCALRCQYCHNPETWACAGAKPMTAAEVFQKAYRYRTYWRGNGGLTVSGGEPLLQLDFLDELFTLAKARGVHTALDTAGQPFTTGEPFFGKFRSVIRKTDLVILDLKALDPALHRRLTGQDNANILAMARWLADNGRPMWIRHVLVPGLTDDAAELAAMGDFIASLPTVERVEVLPYHTLGVFKWAKLGIPYPLEGVRPPTEAEVRQAEALLRCGEIAARAGAR